MHKPPFIISFFRCEKVLCVASSASHLLTKFWNFRRSNGQCRVSIAWNRCFEFKTKLYRIFYDLKEWVKTWRDMVGIISHLKLVFFQLSAVFIAYKVSMWLKLRSSPRLLLLGSIKFCIGLLLIQTSGHHPELVVWNITFGLLSSFYSTARAGCRLKNVVTDAAQHQHIMISDVPFGSFSPFTL